MVKGVPTKMAKDQVSTTFTPETAPEVQVKPKAFKFKLLGGKHFVGETVYRTGDIVPCDDDLIAIHGKPKFELVQG